MRVLGISVWIHFIWIFVVGVLLFFYNVHDGFEGFQGTANSGTAGSTLGTMPSSYIPETPVYINGYIPSNQSWQPINIQTDRFTYQQRFPMRAQLVSENGAYALLFTSRMLILYDTKTMNILWQTPLPGGSSYIFHQGTIDLFLLDGTKSRNLFPATIGSQSGTQTISLTTSYLKLENNGDLVLYSIDGDILFRTNTGVAPNLCKPVNLSYPVTSSDCFNLQSHISDYTSDIAKYSLAGRTGEQDAAQQGLCVSQAYYKQLSCDTYIASHSNPSSAPAPVAPPAPRASIYGSLASGSKQIIVVGDVSTSIMAGDMIYLGYGITIQGPFFVQSTMITPLKPVQGALLSVNQTNINITKHYIGTDIVYPAILSVLPAFRDAGVLRMSSIPVTSTDGSPIIATVYPGDRTISISSGTSGTSGSSTNFLPNLSIGDTIYINKDGCNTFDTFNDNGGGGNDTCTSYLCKVGETDTGYNTCQRYVCGVTMLPYIGGTFPSRDSYNNDGTCTTTITYIRCQANENLVFSSEKIKFVCRGVDYEYEQIVDKQPITYDITQPGRGVKSEIYSKPINIKPDIFTFPPSVDRPIFSNLILQYKNYYGMYITTGPASTYTDQDPDVKYQVLMLRTHETSIASYIQLANSLINNGYGFAFTSYIDDINTREKYISDYFTESRLTNLINASNSRGQNINPYIILREHIYSLRTKCLELVNPYEKLITAVDLIVNAPQTNENNNPSYTYSSNTKLGPFIVAAQPTVSKILIRSLTPGILDLNGNFKLSANSARRATAVVSAKNRNGTIPAATSPVIFLPSSNTVAESNIVPDIGFTGARIHKIEYNPNSSIQPGYNSGNLQFNSDKTISIYSSDYSNSDLDCSFLINGITLQNNRTYTVSISAYSTTICSLELLSPVAGTTAISRNAGVETIRASFFDPMFIPGISKSYMADVNLLQKLSSFFSRFNSTTAANIRNNLIAGAYSYPSSSGASTRVALSPTPTTYTWTIDSIKGSSLYLRAYVPGVTKFTFSNLVIKDTTTNTILPTQISGEASMLAACTPGDPNCCPVGYKCDGTSESVPCPENTYNMPGNVGSCMPCNPNDTALSGTTVCGRKCPGATFASPGTNICNQIDVTGNDGTVSCTAYCGGNNGSPRNVQIPAQWGGAICVGTPEQPWLGCDAIRGSPVKCRCQASPGRGWS